MEGNIELTRKVSGHIAALITIIIWGTTFVSTKILLRTFAPIEILFFRFIIGFVTLILVYPHRLRVKQKKHEIYFMFAGLSGVTLYFLFENIALTYTLASNVGVIISISPFFTAILAHYFVNGENLKKNFCIGFFSAILGIILISFNGSSVLKLNPMGDILAVFASVLWAIYSILTKKIGTFGYNIIQTTRRIFFYGVLFMIPVLFLFDFNLNISSWFNTLVLLNIGYLGFGASALCFVTWNFSVKVLGAVKTSVYIYLVPVITVITSVIVLKESITVISLAGTILTLIGLIISEGILKRRNIDGYKGNEVCDGDR